MAQAIVTKFFGATNNKGARIRISSWLGNKYYSYNYSSNTPHTEAFNQWLKEANEQLCSKYGPDAQFKLASDTYGVSMPDDSGYCFIIE
ncbi:hypothetical protein [Pantoea phage Nufs112]|nr:hypothetical protein [Pantoea phage Nufs112]